MAVTKGVTPVNGGAVSWNRSHVMSALETVFSDLGWNSGSAVSGVPVAIIQPGVTTATELDYDEDHENNLPDSYGQWRRCGGPAIASQQNCDFRLYVTNNGTTDYQIAEELIPENFGVDTTNDYITVGYNRLPTATKLTYAPTGGPGTDAALTGLSLNTVYYMRKISDNQISLHPTGSDATNNLNKVDLTNNPSISNPRIFRTDASANPTLNIKSGDKIYVVQNLASGNWVFLDYAAGGYEADRVLNQTNVQNSTMRNNLSGTGSRVDPWLWNTSYWPITEDEVYDPTKNTDVGYTGVRSYGYGNDDGANGNLKGSIVIGNYCGSLSYGWADNNYWKVTVPASGGRSELKLRVYRQTSANTSYFGTVSSITINSQGNGWSDNDTFTISGADIGGVSPDNDITFGVNAQGSGTNGTPSILTTNIGAGTDFFLKHPDGDYGILRLENDGSKKFGTTYWGFGLWDNNYQMSMGSGQGWTYLNKLGTHLPAGSTGNECKQFGIFNGDMGMDYMYGQNELYRGTSTTGWSRFEIATSSTPTAYPMNIRWWKASNPQDDNFAVIQFSQDINGVAEAFHTFTLHKGPNFGANVFDLDDVWIGTMSEWKTETSADPSLYTRYREPQYDWSTVHAYDEPPTSNTTAREASYGWLRNGAYNNSSYSVQPTTRYRCNIDTTFDNSSNEVVTYYRDSTYDRYQNASEDGEYPIKIDSINAVASNANWYKPIKGIPITNQLAPCPWYVPDDFVLIQAAVTPGATQFQTGDTVTISGSEIYEVIIADQEINKTSLDGVANGTSTAMIFAARTT